MNIKFFGEKLFTKIFFSVLSIVVVVAVLALYFHIEKFLEIRVVASVIILAVALSYLISANISKPIVKIKEGAKRFAEGDFSQKLEPEGPKEIAELAEALNKMAEELNKRIAKISLRKNEQEAMFSSMKEGVIAINANEEIIRINNAALKFFAISSSPQDLKYKSVYEVIRNAEMLDFIKRSLNTDEHIEREITVLGEKERILLVNADPLFDLENKKIGTIIVMNNITRIRQLDKMRQEFVANVSHELKTPITAIKGYVETLLNTPQADEETKRNFLEIINKKSDQLNTIIDDLLQLAKLDKQNKVELTSENICAIVEAAAQCCSKLVERKNINLEIVCEDEIIANVNGNLIERALANLIDNAVKYSPENSKVLVTAKVENGVAKISVRDWGSGIAKEHHARLFERFYRVDKGRSRELGGSGLGLSIVKHIALVHNGKVYVKSELGKGSEFVLEIPLNL